MMIRSPVCGYVCVSMHTRAHTRRRCSRAHDLQSGIGRSIPKATRRASLSSTASRNPSPDVSYLRVFMGAVSFVERCGESRTTRCFYGQASCMLSGSTRTHGECVRWYLCATRADDQMCTLVFAWVCTLCTYKRLAFRHKLALSQTKPMSDTCGKSRAGDCSPLLGRDYVAGAEPKNI